MDLMGVASLLSAGAGVVNALSPLFTNTKTNNNQIGSSTSSQQNNSQTQYSSATGESGVQQTEQQGSIAGIAGMLQSALGTATGNNSEQAFNASQGSATTANNLQTGQWSLANGLNMFSNVMANIMNLQSQTSAQSFNRKEAEVSREWSREMRQTAYQDTMADMKAAGLNPILAASRGASDTPTGANAVSGMQSFSQTSAASIPTAHTASMQALYDYGNNTMQFLNNAMATINNARQIGSTTYEKGAYEMADTILDSSLSTSSQIANEQKQEMYRNIRKPTVEGNRAGGGAGRAK